MALTNEPVLLRITFTPRGEGAALRWEADLLGVRLSRLVHPFPMADLPLILRALDVLQDPAYPVARTAAQTRHFSFDEAERARLAALNLLDDLGHVSGEAPRRLGSRSTPRSPPILMVAPPSSRPMITRSPWASRYTSN